MNETLNSMTEARKKLNNLKKSDIEIQKIKVDQLKAIHRKELAKLHDARIKSGGTFWAFMEHQRELWKMIDAEKKKKK